MRIWQVWSCVNQIKFIYSSGPSKEHLLNEVILQHLYRQGQLDISESLAQVSFCNIIVVLMWY